jgi:putative peptidoglycan lipid II flippase
MLGVGKVSLLYYSDRLMEFPLGLFSIAIATVTLPHLSRQHANQSMLEFSRIIDWSLKLVFLIAVPAAVGLIVLAEPLVATIFYGGEFSEYDVRMTALSLQAFSVGLIGFSLVKILAPAYFAREDTRTPVRIGLIALAVNFVLSVALAYGLERSGYDGTHAGLALATSIAAIVNAWLLYRGLRNPQVLTHASGWGRLLMRFAMANLLMIVSLVLLDRDLDWWLANSELSRSLWLGLTISVGGGVYVASLFLLGMRPGVFRLAAK